MDTSAAKLYSGTGTVQVKRYDSHSGRVNDLSFDEQAEHIASCSEDGKVTVCI